MPYGDGMLGFSVLERSVTLDAPIDEVFRFHLDTRNAPLISPGNNEFVEIAGDFPVHLGSFVRLRVRQKPMPFAQTWVVRIADLEEPTLVTDVAERSPFAYWRHEHHFASDAAGGTVMTDRLEYRLPFGPLGVFADRLLVRHMLDRIFTERHRRTREHFATAP